MSFGRFLALGLVLGLVATGCGKGEKSQKAVPPPNASVQENSAPETTPPPPDSTEAAVEAPSQVAQNEPSSEVTPPATSPELEPEPAPAETPQTPAEVLTPETTESKPEMTPPPPPPDETQKSPTTGVEDPGGSVEVTATKEGLTRIGANKCKMCHKLQYTSWSTTAHAKRTPPLDCESCHGAGSEYKAISVMKDPAKAKAAGLVIPGREFCGICHQGEVSDEMLQQVHAHKSSSTSP
jgi:hypothetical protein